MINNNIGIDLGSENIRFYIEKEDRFINNKSIIAVDSNNNEIISYGLDASKLIEKEPENIILKKPIQKGRIIDIELTVEMLKRILKQESSKKRITNPNILVSYDRNLNEVEKNILVETIKNFGCKNLYLMDSIILSCLGIGMEIEKNQGNMIIDIGYESTKIGIISSNSIIKYKSIPYGGNTFNEKMVSYIRKKYKVLVGYSSVEKLKKEIDTNEKEISGRDLITGLPTNIKITNNDISNCIYKLIDVLVEEIKRMLEKVSPEVIKDISEKGIIISGGGSKLKVLREMLEKKLNMPVLITKCPENNVIEGIKEIFKTDIKRATKI